MSTMPSGYPTRLLLLAVLHAPRHDHADVLQMLAEYLVEVVGELLRLPAAVAPHPGDLLGVLEDRVRVISPTEQLTVHMAGALRGEERDQRRVERGVLRGRRLLAGAFEQARGHAGGAGGRHGVDRDAVLAELQRPDERHAHQARLRGAVVGLPEVAAQPRRGAAVGGTINPASSAGRRSMLGQTKYGAAKAGLMGM